MKVIDESNVNAVKPEVASQANAPVATIPATNKVPENISEFRVKSDSGEVIVDIEEFIKFGAIRKEIKIGSFTVIMKTLPSKERQKALAGVNVDINKSISDYVDKAKIPILSYSIVQINNIMFNSDENRKKLLDVLNEIQDTVLDKLWIEYNKMSNEQFELLDNDDLKKK